MFICCQLRLHQIFHVFEDCEPYDVLILISQSLQSGKEFPLFFFVYSRNYKGRSFLVSSVPEFPLQGVIICNIFL